MKLFKILLLPLLFGSLTPTLFAAHGHINAGAKDTNTDGHISAGDKLFMYFEHGTQLTTLAPNSGTNAYGADGYAWNGFTTFTSLHQSSEEDWSPNYNPVGALSGSYLRMELVSISGPSNAKFAFYDAEATNPAWVYQVGSGIISGSGYIELTELDWFEYEESDPFGHIHDRMFGVDTWGEYTATWRLVDTQSATTGLLNSDLFQSNYSAIPEPSTYMLLLAAGGGFLLLRRTRRKAA